MKKKKIQYKEPEIDNYGVEVKTYHWGTQCRDKKRHISKKEAIKWVHLTNKLSPEKKFTIYLCGWCHFWHVGTLVESE